MRLLFSIIEVNLSSCFFLVNFLKAAKYEIQKPSTCRATLFRCRFSSLFPVFHPARSTWPATKTFFAGWIIVARWLVDLLGHEQTCCATSCEFEEKRASKPKFVAQSRPTLYFSQQLSSTATNVFAARQLDHPKWKTGNIDENVTCNETMLRDKLRVFVSRISPPRHFSNENFRPSQGYRD